jgi:hypothetical protein
LGIRALLCALVAQCFGRVVRRTSCTRCAAPGARAVAAMLDNSLRLIDWVNSERERVFVKLGDPGRCPDVEPLAGSLGRGAAGTPIARVPHRCRADGSRRGVNGLTECLEKNGTLGRWYCAGTQRRGRRRNTADVFATWQRRRGLPSITERARPKRSARDAQRSQFLDLQTSKARRGWHQPFHRQVLRPQGTKIDGTIGTLLRGA